MTQWQMQLDQLRRDQRTPLALAGILALLLVWAALDFIDILTTHRLKINAAKAPITTPHQYNLANLHLFGVYAANLDSLPNAQLPFTLEGTIVMLDAPAQSRALISAENAPAKIYQAGDTLSGNTTITRIAKHYVVVNVNGSLEKLALPIQLLNSE